MKKTKILTTFFILLLMLLTMTACSKKKSSLSEEAHKICGSWAYTHDKEKAIAVFNEDGSAKYEDKDYSFECDSKFIKLKNADGEILKLRYAFDNEGMYLYSNNTYTYSGEGEPADLVGKWSCIEKNWTFSFTNTGKFDEDGFFSGDYTVDKENSTFKLVYNDQFEDTVCYYKLEENKLQIEYPWRMVKMGDK